MLLEVVSDVLDVCPLVLQVVREPNIGKHFALHVDGIRSKVLRPFGLQ